MIPNCTRIIGCAVIYDKLIGKSGTIQCCRYDLIKWILVNDIFVGVSIICTFQIMKKLGAHEMQHRFEICSMHL